MRERVVRGMRDAGQRCSRDTYLFGMFASLGRRRSPFPLDIVAANCLPIKSRRLSTRGKRVAAFLSPISGSSFQAAETDIEKERKRQGGNVVSRVASLRIASDR